MTISFNFSWKEMNIKKGWIDTIVKRNRFIQVQLIELRNTKAYIMTNTKAN
jgi:hypothetical protein